MSKKNREAKFKTTMELAKALSYLEDVVASLRAGTVSIHNGAHSLTLKPESIVKVELGAEQKEDRESLELKLSWRKTIVEPQPHLTIDSRETTPQAEETTPH